MNAYQTLGILHNIDSNMDEESANKKIANTTSKLLFRFVETILSYQSKQEKTIAEKIDKISENVDGAIRLIIASKKIETKEKREKYNFHTEPDIESKIKELNNKNKINGQNAYQLVDMVGKEETVSDEEITNKIYEMYSAILNEIQEDNIQAKLLEMKKIAWAYSKLKDEKSRENYQISIYEEEMKPYYESLAKEGIEKIQNIGITHKLERKDPWSYIYINPEDKKYSSIIISNIGLIEYGTFMIPNEDEVNEYSIVKQRKDGSKEDCVIFSYIDFRKLETDVEYRDLVMEELLSEKSIAMGRKYLAGYVGKIDENGSLSFDKEDIAVCEKWEKFLNKGTKKNNSDFGDNDDR